jgi:hypothetical protein
MIVSYQLTRRPGAAKRAQSENRRGLAYPSGNQLRGAPMDLMNDDRTFQIDPTVLARLQSRDMAVAARSSRPVLISAPPEFALPMAIDIAVGTEEKGADGVVVVDAGDDRNLRSTLARAASADAGQLRAVVVYDVDALNRAQQSMLKAVMGSLAGPRERPCRIIATTSVPLFQRVLQGSFDAGLFYHLNEIHIKIAARLPQDH